MSKIDKLFKEMCVQILEDGTEYHNKKREVKRLQVPSYSFTYHFINGFPAISTKKLYFKSVVGELIWFLRGDNDVEYLNDNKITIWNKDAYNWHKKERNEKNLPFLKEEDFNKNGVGSVGKNYSVQWRNYNGNVDQIKRLIENMKKDIMSSQLLVNAWNPSEIYETALPPCHTGFQIIGEHLYENEFGFYLKFHMRSWDVFLGAPFNIASYALLAKILEYITDFKALGVIVDASCPHFYENQIEAVKELISRDTEKHDNCDIEFVNIPEFKDVDSFFNQLEISNFKLVNYTSESELKVEMLAPKNL